MGSLQGERVDTRRSYWGPDGESVAEYYTASTPIRVPGPKLKS